MQVLPTSPRILAIGQSHLAAIIRANQLDPTKVLNLTFLLLNRSEFRPVIDDGRLNPNLTTAICRSSPELTILAVAGNEHNVLGLINNPRRFDFVLPQEPELPLDDGAEVLPSGIVRNWIWRKLQERSFALMQKIQASVNGPIWALEPPPPIPSENHVRQHAEPAFRERMAKFGIGAPLFRYKLWRLQSALTKEFCDANSIHFVEVPKNIQDERGMLAEHFWSNDATHANVNFGEQVLTAISQKIASHLKFF